jgi:hypothetical protein
MKKVILLTSFVFAGLLGYSQCTWDGGGDGTSWSDPDNWSGNGCDSNGAIPLGTDEVPDAGDAVTIAGFSVNITSAGAVAGTLTVQGDNVFTDGSLTISASGTLTVAGNITLNDNTLGANDGTLSITGGDVIINSPGVLAIEAGGIFNISSGSLSLFATTPITNAGTFQSSGGTVYYKNGSAQNINLALDYPTVEISDGATVTVIAAVTDVDNLTISDGDMIINDGASFDASSTGEIIMADLTSLTINGDANFPVNLEGTLDAGSTVTFAKTSETGMVSPDNVDFGTVDFTTSVALGFTGANNTVQTALNITSGDITFNENWEGSEGTSTFTILASQTAQYSGTANFPLLFTTYTFDPASSVKFIGSTQNVGKSTATITFGNLDILGTAGTKTLIGDINVAGTLTVNAAGTIFDIANTKTATLTGGNAEVTIGTLRTTTGTLIINDSHILNIGGSGTFNMTGGALKLHTATGAIVNGGTWTTPAGTVHFTRSTDDTQVIDVALDYPNIEIDGGQQVTVTNTIADVNDLTISNGELIIADGSALSGGTNLVMLSGTNLTINGDANFPSGYTGTLDAASTVTFAKNNTETMTSPAGIAFGNVVINSTGADLTFSGATNSVKTLFDIDNGIVQLTSSNWDEAGASAATLDVAAGATLQYNNGNFPSDYNTYTFAPSSNVIFNGGSQNVSRASGADIIFGNLTIQGGGGTKTLLDNITVAGNLLVSTGTTLETTQALQITGGAGSVTVTDGTLIIGLGDLPTFATYDFDATSSEVVFNDADGAQSVSNGTHVFDNLTINGGNTKTVDHNITVEGILDINGTTVTLYANANAIDGDFTLNIAAGDFLETSALVPFGGTVVSGAIDATSTTTYNGGAQQVEALNYGNLTIDQAGIKTLQVGTSVTTGNVTISNTATFDLETFAFTGAGGKTLNINDDCRLALSGTNNFPTGFGNFTFNTTSTVDYDAVGNQTIALQPYANLDITGGGIKTVGSGEASVTGILDVENGATIATDLGTGKFLRLISTGDGATQTARIADLTGEGATGILSGDGFICERDMDLTGPDAVGWNDWASPIVGFRLASWYYTGWPMTGVGGIRGTDFPSNPWCSVLTYNANNIGTPSYLPSNVNDGLTDKNDGWERVPNITDGNTPGTGFRLYTGARDRELEDYGLPAQGTVAITLNYEATAAAAAEEGWNLVGNPYMCAVDFTELSKTGSIEASMWMYSNVGKGYYAFNDATGAGTAPFDVLDNNSTIANGYIPSHKAFWVRVTAATQTLTFEEADKVTGGTAYVKSGATLPKLRVQAQNLNNGFFSTGVIVKHDDATNGLEKYDSEIFKAISATAPNLYFLSEEGKQLSIDAVPNNVSVIPMQVEAGISGDFELRFWDFNEIHSGSCIMLEDKFTDEWFDLREEQSIVRTLSDTTTIARFNVHIKQMLNTELVANTTCFGTNDGEVLVENLSENVIGLALYDEVGALVYEDMVTNNKIWGDLAPGTYTLREATTNIGCPSAFTTVEVFEPAEVIASFDKSLEEIDLATDNGEVQFTSTSTGGEEHIWYFSDDNEFSFEVNPTHTFSTPGLHDVSLLVHNGNYDCAKVHEDQVLVKSSVGITEEVLDEALVNATVVDGQAKLNMNFESPENVTVLLFDMAGKELGQWSFEQVSNNTEFIDLPTTKGIYLLKVQAANKKRTFRLF